MTSTMATAAMKMGTTTMDIEDKIALAKKFIAQREEIDRHLSELFGGEPAERKRGACSSCGLAGHNARSCPSIPKANGVAQTTQE